MDAVELPKEGRLRNLLEECPSDHDIILFHADDGAFIMECLECPFHCIFSPEEEAYMYQRLDEKQVEL